MLRFLKWAFAVAGGLFVLLIVLAFIVKGNFDRETLESPLLIEFATLEQQRDFSTLAGRFIAAAPQLDERECRLVIRWLKQRADRGDLPYLYFLSLCTARQGRWAESARWYASAALVARTDAARCEDRTCGQAVTVLESSFGKVREWLAAHPQDKERAFQEALRYEEKIKERPVAPWISQHGIQAFSGKQKFLSNADWQAARARIRTEFTAGTGA